MTAVDHPNSNMPFIAVYSRTNSHKKKKITSAIAKITAAIAMTMASMILVLSS